MGMIASIYRSDYDCHLNAFHGSKQVCVVNVEGPFEPNDRKPAAMLIPHNCFGDEIGKRMAIIVPCKKNDKDEWEPIPSWERMFGGSFCDTSDSRFSQAVRGMLGVNFYGAVPIHDRIER